MDELSSADAAAAGAAAERALAAIEARWECVDGPLTANFNARRVQGDDLRLDYVSFQFGHASLNVLVEWLPDGVDQFADEHGRQWVEWIGPKSTEPSPTPKTHRIVWRKKPEFGFAADLQRWLVYCRFVFMPKDVWFLEPEKE